MVGEDATREVASAMVETKGLAEESGLRVEVLSAGGTHNYEIMGAIPGITEVCAGAYALLDSRYAAQKPGLEPAARVMATVIGRPEPGLAITDTGQKAAGADFGLAHLDASFDASLKSLSAEHGSLALADEEAKHLRWATMFGTYPRTSEPLPIFSTTCTPSGTVAWRRSGRSLVGGCTASPHSNGGVTWKATDRPSGHR